MKIVKVLGWGLVVVIAFVALSVYMTAANIDHIVKQTVEKVGSDTLKTSVTLDGVAIDLWGARATLSGLTIDNPEPFTGDYLFKLDDIHFDLNLEALLQKTVDISIVSVEGVHVIAEQKGTQTNIQTLLKSLESKVPTEKPEQPSNEGQGAAADFLIRVGRFDFSKSSLALITEKWGEQQVDLPSILLQNLGGERGVPADQFAHSLFQQLLRKLNSAAEKAIKEQAKRKLEEKLKAKEDELKSKARDKLQEKLGEQAGGVESSLKSLLSR